MIKFYCVSNKGSNYVQFAVSAKIALETVSSTLPEGEWIRSVSPTENRVWDDWV